MDFRYRILAVLALATASVASAHITYTNRNFGALSETVTTISNQTVSSSFGWADATDSDYGDSHRGRFFKFHLNDPATVQIVVQRNSLGTGPQNTFLPAFSIFQGLASGAPEQAPHDGAAFSIASRPVGTEGSARALVDWSCGNDETYVTSGNPASGVLFAPRLSNFTYMGHAADGNSGNYGSAPGISGDGLADGFVSGNFALPAGDFTLWVAGANYDGQLSEGPTTFPTFGVTVSAGINPLPVSAKSTTWSRVKSLYRH